MKLRDLVWAAGLAAGVFTLPAEAAPGADLLKSQCMSCHALAKPQDSTIDRLYSRKAPDLYYAGVKFNKDWLVGWLQNPTVIRPGGVMYSSNVKAGAPGTPDEIDTAKLQPHLKLSAADAQAAAEALMTLGVNDGLLQKGAYQAPSSPGMASLLFNKLRGCASCHSAKPGSGGLSGPELYSAGDRLQSDYVVEYIRNPQKFDPHVWMPKLELNDADVQKLAAYLATLKQGGAK